MTPREVFAEIERIAAAHGTNRSDVSGKLCLPELRAAHVRAARLAIVERLRARGLEFGDIGAALSIADETARRIYADAHPREPVDMRARRARIRATLAETRERNRAAAARGRVA